MKNQLKVFRGQAKLTLQGLADMYGGTKSHCWALEKGTSTPTLTTAYAIAKVLGKSVYMIWPDETKIIEETVIVRRVKLNTYIEGSIAQDRINQFDNVVRSVCTELGITYAGVDIDGGEIIEAIKALKI